MRDDNMENEYIKKISLMLHKQSQAFYTPMPDQVAWSEEGNLIITREGDRKDSTQNAKGSCEVLVSWPRLYSKTTTVQWNNYYSSASPCMCMTILITNGKERGIVLYSTPHQLLHFYSVLASVFLMIPPSLPISYDDRWASQKHSLVLYKKLRHTIFLSNLTCSSFH